MSELKIGLSKVVITPPAKSCALEGIVYYRPSKYVESDLCANAVVFEGEDTMIICSCDLLQIPTEFKKRILAHVSEMDPTIDTEKVSVNATHTHNGPYVFENAHPWINRAAGLPEGYTYEDDYEYDPDVWMGDKTIPHLTKKIAEAIVKAWQNRKKGYFSPGFGRCVVGFTRRTQYRDGKVINYGVTNSVNFDCMQGANDSGVEMLFLFDENKKPTGAVINVACPAQVLEQVHIIGADYWGKCRDFLEEDFGKDFVLVGLCGASGDMTPRDLVRLPRYNYLVEPMLDILPRRTDPEIYSMESLMDVSERLTMEIRRIYNKVKDNLSDSSVIRYKKINLTLPGITVPNELYKESKKIVADYVEKLDTKVLSSNDMEQIRIPLERICRYKEQEFNRMVNVEVHIMRLDDMVFVTNPFELFMDYGNRIKTRSHATQTFVIQLANGASGYLPSKIAYASGGYAVDTVCYVEQEAGELLTESTIAAIMDIMK